MMILFLPIFCITYGALAFMTRQMRSSMLDTLQKDFIRTAKAKGLSENKVLYKHVFRSAMLIVVSGIPDAMIKVLFTGSLLIEIVFSLDGIGLLGYESAISRDYPVVFGTLFIFTLIGLLINLITSLKAFC